jgi:hypothetical protein
VRVVTLPKGQDPADAPAGFEQRLGGASSYVVHRVRLELERTPDRQEAFVGVREVLSRFDDSPERQDALRLAADRLDLPAELQAGFAPSSTAAATGSVSAKVLGAGDRLERDALAGCLAHPSLVPMLGELTPEHFDSEAHRALRQHIVERGEPAAELVPLLAELDAVAAREALDERVTEELLLRLRERWLRREIARSNDDFERTRELQASLERVREAVGSLV